MCMWMLKKDEFNENVKQLYLLNLSFETLHTVEYPLVNGLLWLNSHFYKSEISPDTSLKKNVSYHLIWYYNVYYLLAGGLQRLELSTSADKQLNRRGSLRGPRVHGRGRWRAESVDDAVSRPNQCRLQVWRFFSWRSWPHIFIRLDYEQTKPL